MKVPSLLPGGLQSFGLGPQFCHARIGGRRRRELPIVSKRSVTPNSEGSDMTSAPPLARAACTLSARTLQPRTVARALASLPELRGVEIPFQPGGLQSQRANPQSCALGYSPNGDSRAHDIMGAYSPPSSNTGASTGLSGSKKLTECFYGLQSRSASFFANF